MGEGGINMEEIVLTHNGISYTKEDIIEMLDLVMEIVGVPQVSGFEKAKRERERLERNLTHAECELGIFQCEQNLADMYRERQYRAFCNGEDDPLDEFEKKTIREVYGW